MAFQIAPSPEVGFAIDQVAITLEVILIFGLFQTGSDPMLRWLSAGGLSCCVLGWMLGGAVIAAAPIQYTVSIEAPQTHYLHVEARVQPAQAGELELFLPVWTPGSYLVREYARHIDSFEATTADNQKLAWTKVSKNRWKIQGVPAAGVTVRYRVYCNELSVRTNFVDADFGILSGAATFMTCRELMGQEHTVQLKLPAVWRQSLTALEHPVSAPAHSYRATNFDELVDSPILLGNPTVHAFRVGEAEHFLVNQGGDPYWNGDLAAADVAKIVAEHQQMWGVVPYKRYYFFNIIAEAGGGLEHNNSTVLITSRYHFRNPVNYKKWLGLVSHEFFHAWNVRRLRPKALARYDYETEMVFDELWISEGITSYYEELALVRAGLNSPKAYLADLSKQIESVQSGPGRLKQSLIESSRDAWIKFYRPDENTSNTSVNYYTKGAIAGWLLDARIRKATNNGKSLDDVMRTLYQRYADKEGFNNQEFVQVASEVAGQDVGPWFETSVRSAVELEYQEALDWLGLAFKESGAEEKVAAGVDAAGAGEAKSEAPAKVKPLWSGITVDARQVITRIVEGSPAFLAGLNVGDELIGVDGFRLSEPVDERLKQYKAGETVRILVARRGQLVEVPCLLVEKPAVSWTLELRKQTDAPQKQSYANWLHLPPG